MDTINFIKQRLDECKGNWPAVCEQTGLDYSWLTKFAQGKIPNPGFAKVQTLVAHFATTKRTNKA